jgi:hypothetical protein
VRKRNRKILFKSEKKIEMEIFMLYTEGEIRILHVWWRKQKERENRMLVCK